LLQDGQRQSFQIYGFIVQNTYEEDEESAAATAATAEAAEAKPPPPAAASLNKPSYSLD
jgi:hypothetical protein